MVIRVVHIVHPSIGTVFSGITHRIFSLLSGWKDKDILLDLYGTQLKPLNMNCGNKTYVLSDTTLWSSNTREQSRWDSVIWSFKLLWILISHQKEYDIVQFHRLGWGSLLSPFFLHPLGKKLVFSMSLLGNDNPSYIRNQPRGRLQVALLRKFDGAIGISPALVDDAIKNGIRNVICLPNFMAIPQLEEDLDDETKLSRRFESRIKLAIPQEAQVLLFVGSVIYRKGVDIIVDSFKTLAKKYPNLVLILVGPQSKSDIEGINEGYISQLKTKIHKEDLQDRVIWAGMVRDQSSLVEYYRSADIFVFPTRNEGLGNVLIEAMAARLPVVATCLPGITDIVVSEDASGYLIEQEKTEEFTLAIDKLLQDDSLREEMGKAGRKIVIEKFGFNSYCHKLKQFYVDLFAKKT